MRSTIDVLRGKGGDVADEGGKPGRQSLSRIREVLRRIETAFMVATRTGLLRNLHFSAVVKGVRLARAGNMGPSFIYRFHAANTPGKVALIHQDVRHTFSSLDARCDRLAAGLFRRGLAGGSILVMMKNRPEHLMVATAASRIGSPMVAISWRSTPAELIYMAMHCGAKAIVFDESAAPSVEKARADLNSIPTQNFFMACDRDVSCEGVSSIDDLSKSAAESAPAAPAGPLMFYTSGTTGKPKAAVRPFNKNLLPALLRLFRETPLRHDDVHLTVCPLYHSTAVGFIHMTYTLGATVVLLDEFDPRKFLQAIERYRVTTTVLVPTMLHRILNVGDEEIRRYDTSSLRALFCSGAPLPAPDCEHAMRLFGDVLFNLYGATETGLVTLAHPDDLRRSPGTIGRPVPGNEIRLLDENGIEVRAGEVGELYTRSATLISCYHGDEQATRLAMKDGYFSVGDLARVDAYGCYHLEGRKCDMIIAGGVNVYPAEVEAAIESNRLVDEVAVVGESDPEWGERVKAVVALRPGLETVDAAAELLLHCKALLSGPKVPREFMILPRGEALPRTASGKVLKRALRRAATTCASAPSRDAK